MKTNTNFLTGLAILLLMSTSIFAQLEPRKTDLPGSNDYPLIYRYKGAVIQNYEEIDYRSIGSYDGLGFCTGHDGKRSSENIIEMVGSCPSSGRG